MGRYSIKHKKHKTCTTKAKGRYNSNFKKIKAKALDTLNLGNLILTEMYQTNSNDGLQIHCEN